MIVERLSLKGYKRIMLSDIRELSIEFNSPYQIILGTNGSGKSSLLKEVSPLPGNPNDYEKGGYKYFEGKHHHHHYQLESTYEGSKNHHSFLKDDVELNDGGTITVQRELVKQEFGITDELHELLMGKQRFTQMGPTKRRDIITQMSDNDLTYAFGVFKKLSSRVRDHQGTLKHIKSRLARETDALRAMDVHEDLDYVVTKLQDELTVLMQERRTDLPASTQLEQELNENLDRIRRLSTGLLQNPLPTQAIEQYGSPEALEEHHTTLNHDLTTKGKLLSHYSEEHNKFQKLVGSLDESGVENVEDLQGREAKLLERMESVKKTINQFTFEGDLTDLEAESQNLKSKLVDLLSTMPSNEDKRYSRKNLETVETEMQQLQSRYEEALSRQRRCDQDIQHILEAKETKCPKCNYVWKEGVSEGHLEELKAKSAKLQSIAEDTKKNIDTKHAFREEIRNYSNQYSRLRTLAHTYPKAQNLFDWLMEGERICYQPSQLIPTIDRWLDDLHRHTELWSLTRELDVIRQTIRRSKALEESGAGQVGDTMASLEKTVQELTDDLGTVKKSLTETEKLVALVKKRDAWAEELSQLIAKVDELHGTLQHSMKSESLGDLIRAHQNQLAGLTRKLNDKKNIENIIGDLEKSLTEVEDAHRINKLLATAMSPTDGVIAKQMSAFIDCLVQQMNDVIEQVYTYPLKVYPCGIGSGELDYKFPLKAGDDQTDAKDVSMGSDGQQEIVDFAFKLVAILYLGFSEYPLFLDEMGRHQDETHLTNVMNYVKMLIEANRHSQLFMISHFAVGHGGFTNADVLVLNGSNITVPLKHNEHAEIS